MIFKKLLLQACKCKKCKPHDAGRIDGKCGPKTICEIEEFQSGNGLKITGKIESYGPTINRLRQKTPMTVKNKLDQSGGGGHGAGGCLAPRLLKLAFSERLEYLKGEGFRTPAIAQPLLVLGSICGEFYEVARRGGRSFELFIR